MNIKFNQLALALLFAGTSSLAVAESAMATDKSKHSHCSHSTSKEDCALIEKLKQQVEEVAKIKRIEQVNLANFDDLDFNVFSSQKWDQLNKSHGKDIIVHWPDGRVTQGIDAHITDLKALFAFAPDTRIKEHSIRIASAEWTAVYGLMEGTFTLPMAIGEGKTIAPTGKSYKIGMITIGHWTKEGFMDEEWLQWDNQFFMKQLGLGQ